MTPRNNTPMRFVLPVACVLSSVSFAQDFTITQLQQQANDLVWDAASGQLFASVPGTIGTGGNSVVSIDPVSQTVGSSTFVGSQPNKLAVSDDGQYLYVGLEGVGSVQRVHLPSRTADLTIDLGSDPFFGPLYTEDLAVQPGNPTVFAVSRKRLGVSPKHGGVAVFEGDVMRPNDTPSHTGSNVIEWSEAADTVYGYNNETTDFGVRTMEVSSSGIVVTQSLSTAIAGGGIDIEYSDGVLYSTNGAAINPATGFGLGTYANLTFGFQVAVNPLLDRVYFVGQNTLRVYQRSTFVLLDTILIAGIQGTPRNLVRWGDTSLAFSTDAGEVFLLTGDESCDASWTNYCSATANSTGAPAAIALSGTLSVLANDTRIQAVSLPAEDFGLFLYGPSQGGLPWGDGTLCIDIFSGINRLPGLSFSSPQGTVDEPLPFPALDAEGEILGGSTWNFQYWYRDSSPNGFNLSNGASVSFCP